MVSANAVYLGMLFGAVLIAAGVCVYKYLWGVWPWVKVDGKAVKNHFEASIKALYPYNLSGNDRYYIEYKKGLGESYEQLKYFDATKLFDQWQALTFGIEELDKYKAFVATLNPQTLQDYLDAEEAKETAFRKLVEQRRINPVYKIAN
ncbi:MAG: hypothetical protein WCO55_02935 [Candidatus Falkowbacteria bacterium]